MLQIPQLLDTPEFLTKEITFKWEDKSVDYFTYKVENEKLIDTLWKLNHKSTLGLVAACGEWVFWRFSKIYEKTSVAINAMEPLWLGLIDKHYIKNWKFTSPPEDTIYKNILWIIFNSHLFIRDNYIKGDYQIQFRVMNMIMLARHVTPNNIMFDDWLSDCLKRSIELFPAQYDRGKTLGKTVNGYDSSNEPPIPREFYFEPDFDYEAADIDKLMEKFMNEVDHSNETFFKSAKDMLAEGFQGTPYKYEPKGESI